VVIEWSRRTRTDIRDLKDYIAKDSPYYARQFTEPIVASVEKLVDFPKIGRPVPEAKAVWMCASRSIRATGSSI